MSNVNAAAQVTDFLQDRAAELRVPDPAWGIFADGELLAGRNERGIYRIASMTKSFTAAAVLGLRVGLIPSAPGAPALDLDEPLVSYLPQLRAAGAPMSLVTVRNALTMSAGLPTDDPWADRQETLPAAAFDTLMSTPAQFSFTPGTGFTYSNYGYALLGRLVEVLTGRGYCDVVAKHLLADLPDTDFAAEALETSRVVPGFRVDGAGQLIKLPLSRPGAFSAIGGLFSTVMDIGHWMQRFSAAYRGAAGGWDRVLRDMAQGQRFVEVVDGAADLYGYGLHSRVDPRFGQLNYHAGGYPGYGSHMRWHPASGAGIVVFANRTYGPGSTLAREGMEMFLELTGQGPQLPARFTAGEYARSLPARVEAVIGGAEDESVFASNVALDVPWDERRAEWTDILTHTGELGPHCSGREPGAALPPDVAWTSPSRASWTVAGPLAERRVTITLNPFNEVQAVTVALD